MGTAISGKTMGGWYRNFLVLNQTTNAGISGANVSVMDGAGKSTALKIGETDIKLKDGGKIYFKDNNYIYNSGADALRLKSTKTTISGVASVIGKTHLGLVSTVSIANASMIRTKNLKSSGTASMATVSSVTYKGTNIKITGTVSCASLKAALDLTGLTGKSIKLSTLPINLYNDTTILDANASGLHFRFAGTAALDSLTMKTASLIPQTNNSYDLGTSAKMFKTVYGSTGVFSSATITTAAITGGNWTAAGLIGASRLNASNVSIKREVKMNAMPLYMDANKRFSVQYSAAVSAIAIDTPASTIYIKSDNTIYPSANDVIDLGITAKRFRTLYCGSAYLTNGLNANQLTTKYLNIGSIPATSSGLVAGDVYEIASVLYIKK